LNILSKLCSSNKFTNWWWFFLQFRKILSRKLLSCNFLCNLNFWFNNLNLRRTILCWKFSFRFTCCEFWRSFLFFRLWLNLLFLLNWLRLLFWFFTQTWKIFYSWIEFHSLWFSCFSVKIHNFFLFRFYYFHIICRSWLHFHWLFLFLFFLIYNIPSNMFRNLLFFSFVILVAID